MGLVDAPLVRMSDVRRRLRQSRVIGAVLTVLALACEPLWARGADAPVPIATPSLLPFIGTTKTTRPLCQTLRSAIAPAVSAVMLGDNIIAVSKTQYAHMALYGSRQDLDLIAMSKKVQALVHNLDVAQSEVTEMAKLQPSSAVDDHALAAVKADLQDIVTEQTVELNTINGVLETIRLKKMMGGIPGTPSWLVTTRPFFRDVAEAIAEQAAPISVSESKLSPALVSLSITCGATKP